MVLTKKQQQVLDALTFLIQKGENPTVREVAALLGLSSPATVHKHLQALEQGGFIEQSGKSRGIKLRKPSASQPGLAPRPEIPLSPGIPLAGRIAAGQPIENPESGGEGEELALDPQFFSPKVGLFSPAAERGEIVALQVVGDSMVEAGILNGDIVIVRRQPTVEEGEIAAVTVDGAGTLKRWHLKKSAGGSPRPLGVSLHPANARFAPIEIDAGQHREVRVFGKYLGLIRCAARSKT